MRGEEPAHWAFNEKGRDTSQPAFRAVTLCDVCVSLEGWGGGQASGV